MRNVAVSLIAILALALCAQAQPGFSISASDEVMGAADAPVTLIEYASPSCPHCARFNAEQFPALKRKYIDTGKVRLVFRLFPLRALDGDAEKLARCAPDYFRFMDTLFRNQDKWDPEYGISDSRPPLVALAVSVGLSAQQASACMNDTARDAAINAVAQEAETRYGVNGTPTFVINGVAQPSGFRSPDQVTSALDAALAKKR